MPACLEGVEIEIRQQQDVPDLETHPVSPHQDPCPLRGHGDHEHRRHVEVLPRPTPVGFVSSAVFPELTQGRYELYERPSGPVRLQVRVTGGQVTQASWPSPDDPAGLV
jgi:hypothetical protein